jgi:hypothetical protein
MRKILMAGAMLGLLLGVAAPITASALTLGPGSLVTSTDNSSLVTEVARRGGGVAFRGRGGRGAVAWRGRGGRGGVAWRGPRRGGVAWRGPRRGGVAWRRGIRPGWRVGWVGPGYYYNPAFYNRYYNPRWGYCRIIWWNGAQVCRWYRSPWW